MSLYKKLFAHSLAAGDDAQHRIYGEKKRRLFADLRGTVVEIGPGTGVNLPYLPEGIRWIGLEPNPHMHPFLREELEGRDIDAEILDASAQNTGLPDASTDALARSARYLARDVGAALGELHRIDAGAIARLGLPQEQRPAKERVPAQRLLGPVAHWLTSIWLSCITRTARS